MSPLVVVWLLLLGNTAGMDQKDSITVVMAAYARLVLLVSLLALFFFCRCQALMPCIMAGMDQINSYAVFDQGHLLPCCGAEATPMVGIPQLPYIGGRCPCYVLQLPCRGAEAVEFPESLFDKVVSATVFQVVQVERVPQVPSWRIQSCSHG